MKFRIPDFALGALFMFIMASIAVLLCFPNVVGDDLCWALVGIAAIAWAIGSGLFESPSQISRSRNEENITEYERPHRIDKPTISANAAAIVDAINQQERANREQESAEDESKRRREFITIFIIAITGLAILLQVNEMRKAYEPLRAQADYARKAFISSERARLGIISSTIENFSKGSWAFGQLNYSNAGHDAAPTDQRIEIVPFSAEEWEGGKIAAQYIRDFADKCKSVNIIQGVVVAFQEDVNRTGYAVRTSLPIKDHPAKHYVFVDDSVISGDKYIAVLGCLSYKSVESVFHTGSCQYFKSGYSMSPESLNICDLGNFAE